MLRTKFYSRNCDRRWINKEHMVKSLIIVLAALYTSIGEQQPQPRHGGNSVFVNVVYVQCPNLIRKICWKGTRERQSGYRLKFDKSLFMYRSDPFLPLSVEYAPTQKQACLRHDGVTLSSFDLLSPNVNGRRYAKQSMRSSGVSVQYFF